MAVSETLNVDCEEYMKTLPDKYFDLALVDPEYRDENQPDIHMRQKGGLKDWRGMPKPSYFKELMRVSKHQIIFGGNYFTDIIDPITGLPCLEANNNWFIWFKQADGLHFSMAEMAWVSIRKNIKVFSFRPMGYTMDWHETSKPIQVYKYILETYADKGWKILDTNLGSGSSRRAAHLLGFDFVGCEIQKGYFDKEKEEFEKFVKAGDFIESPSNINAKKKEWQNFKF